MEECKNEYERNLRKALRRRRLRLKIVLRRSRSVGLRKVATLLISRITKIILRKISCYVKRNNILFYYMIIITMKTFIYRKQLLFLLQ